LHHVFTVAYGRRKKLLRLQVARQRQRSFRVKLLASHFSAKESISSHAAGFIPIRHRRFCKFGRSAHDRALISARSIVSPKGDRLLRNHFHFLTVPSGHTFLLVVFGGDPRVRPRGSGFACGQFLFGASQAEVAKEIVKSVHRLRRFFYRFDLAPVRVECQGACGVGK
jgi:hypothetical protein